MIEMYPLLVGDIGGTNVRFGWIENANSEITEIMQLACNQHATIEEAIRTYLKISKKSIPQACSFGIANPITGDHVKMTNHHWSFSIDGLKRNLGLKEIKVINDFTALALSIPNISKKHLKKITDGNALPHSPIALIGPGTGLGISGLIPDSTTGKWIPIAGEGGHATLAAQTRIEFQVIELLTEKYGHVSAERVLSGQGLIDVFHALGKIHKIHTDAVSSAAEVSYLAHQQHDELALNTIDIFSGWLGSVAGDLVLMLGARGGLYIGGGIVPQWIDWFENTSFSARFTSKGRFTQYMQHIPVWIINAPHSPALHGAARSIQG